MIVERVRLEGDPAAFAARLRTAAETQAPEEVERAVAEIVADVAARGDRAVADHTRRLDTEGADPPPLRVDSERLEAALAGLDSEVREALETASANVRAVAEAGLREPWEVQLGQGQRVGVREVPVARAGIYVPGGRAPYPSTVVMGAVTAAAAGVGEVAVCAPPGPDGPHPVVLAACALCGVEEVYAMGGAQAIAALALGTETVGRVAVVAGPGNRFVTEAKRQLFGRVGLDGLAGPSEAMVAFEDPEHARVVALDLLAQGEHGPDSLLVACSSLPAALDALAAALEEMAGARPTVAAARCVLVDVAGPEEALALADALAPEHLELLGGALEARAGEVRTAGCVFAGPAGGTAFGDYVAGSNHVLPTGGAARFASALSPAHFRRRVTEVRIDGEAAERLAGPGAALARAEGFAVHAESMEARIRENRPS